MPLAPGQEPPAGCLPHLHGPTETTRGEPLPLRPPSAPSPPPEFPPAVMGQAPPAGLFYLDHPPTPIRGEPLPLRPPKRQDLIPSHRPLAPDQKLPASRLPDLHGPITTA